MALTQMGADDCQRYPGLKCLLVRKVGKSNLENFDDIRRRAFGNLQHHFIPSKKTLIFENGSRIISGHFQTESEIDAYLGLEYDVIGIEEATTLTHRKHIDLSTCCRTSKKNWRPRIYSTSNPGGVGHVWYRNKFIIPHQNRIESDTRFIPARVTDNLFTNPEYKYDLEKLTGWQKRAWLHGDWDIAAGQFFSSLPSFPYVKCPRHESAVFITVALHSLSWHHFDSLLAINHQLKQPSTPSRCLLLNNAGGSFP